jgi:hypothetical protein
MSCCFGPVAISFDTTQDWKDGVIVTTRSSVLVVLQPEPSGNVATVVAVQQVRRMRGGAQSHLMRCSDDNLYVVKFQNNPQDVRVLANEMFAGLLARLVGLPVPTPTVVDVSEWLVHHTPEMNIQLVSGTVPCQSGLQFGSRYVVKPQEGQVFDFLAGPILAGVRNLGAFAGILAMDKWTCNRDARQAAFWRVKRQHDYTAAFIDQGYCFNGGGWDFPDSPLRGVYEQDEAYAGVLGWDSFEPWLSQIEDLSLADISAVADEIPPGWYGSNSGALDHLVQMLLERRSLTRGLLTAFRSSSRHPFPNWRDTNQSQPPPRVA